MMKNIEEEAKRMRRVFDSYKGNNRMQSRIIGYMAGMGYKDMYDKNGTIVTPDDAWVRANAGVVQVLESTSPYRAGFYAGYKGIPLETFLAGEEKTTVSAENAQALQEMINKAQGAKYAAKDTLSKRTLFGYVTGLSVRSVDEATKHVSSVDVAWYRLNGKQAVSLDINNPYRKGFNAGYAKESLESVLSSLEQQKEKTNV